MERLSRGLGDDGGRALGLHAVGDATEGGRMGAWEDISKTLRFLSDSSQPTFSCLRDHRRLSLSGPFHRTVCSSAGASILLTDAETKKKRYVNL